MKVRKTVEANAELSRLVGVATCRLWSTYQGGAAAAFQLMADLFSIPEAIIEIKVEISELLEVDTGVLF